MVKQQQRQEECRDAERLRRDAGADAGIVRLLPGGLRSCVGAGAQRRVKS